VANSSNRRGSAGSNRSTLSRHPLAVACAAAFMLASNAGYSQDAAAPAAPTQAETDAAKAKSDAAKNAAELETVQVVGIRLGIENAIETKQTNTSIVESISAEDIGKLPDSSIAESIARLPGLTAQRERGRATQINIRGLSGDFAGTTLNGREQTTTSDNRGVEFDQYPSELLSAVVVYKTPDATLVGQGLSGTVDLRTARPLDFSERVISANFRFEQNELEGGKEYGNRYSFSYIDQFADNTVGLAIGYAHLDSPQPGFQNEAWGYGSTATSGGNQVFGGGKVYQFDANNERDGVMATLQFKPNDFYETSLDIFYSKYDKTEVKTGVEFGTSFGSGTLLPGWTSNGNGTITNSSWVGVKPVLRMDSNPSEDELNSYGWNNIFTINDNWTVTADLSYSKTQHQFRVLETYAGIKTNGGASALDVDLNSSGLYNDYTFDTDLNDPNNLQLIDAGGWGQDGYIKDFDVTDKLTAFRLEASRSFDEGWISSIDFGYNRTDRSKDKSAAESKLCIDACQGGDTAPFPGQPGTSEFIGLTGGIAVFDANDLYESGFYNTPVKYDPDIANKNWSVDETLDTFFAQANIDTDVGDMPLRGNFGFQYVSVDQSSEGYSTYAGNPAGTLDEDGDSYSDFLPSLNLSLEFMPEAYARFAAAKQMARPRLDQLRASKNVSNSASGCADIVGPLWCGGGGNPRLQPWKANAYDLSFEKYFTTELGNKGYVAAAYFFKDLDTYIYSDDTAYDYAGSPLPPPTPIQVPGVTYPDSTVGVINQPINGEGGYIKGVEFTLSVPFDLLWKPLQGFGMQGSYSDTKSSIKPNGPGTTQPLPGLSKYVSNITVYYERYGFSARYSSRTRSDFRGETRGFGADYNFIDINAERVQDAQINYTFREGSLEGLALYLQVSNIGDEPFSTSSNGDPARPATYFEYGRTSLLGFSYKF